MASSRESLTARSATFAAPASGRRHNHRREPHNVTNQPCFGKSSELTPSKYQPLIALSPHQKLPLIIFTGTGFGSPNVPGDAGSPLMDGAAPLIVAETGTTRKENIDQDVSPGYFPGAGINRVVPPKGGQPVTFCIGEAWSPCYCFIEKTSVGT
jgi:hypothetical protein